MPDLSEKGSHEFWHAYDDPMIYRVICFLEAIEDWTPDGDDNFETAMQALGTELEDLSKVDMASLGHEETFVRLCANVKSGRALRLLQAIDTAHPGSASKVLIHAEETTQSAADIPGIFLRRNIVFERLRLLGRVFSKERLELALHALEGEDTL
jgi:intracellular multiplication protein IcmW